MPSVEADTKEPSEVDDEGFDPNKVYLHFRELPKDAFSAHRDHVVAILRPESAKGEDTIILKPAEIERWKTELQSWANGHVKKLIMQRS